MVFDPLTTFGDFPPFLVRAFNEEKWARAFADEGRMRFSLLEYFTEVEDDARADGTEGEARLQIPHLVQSLRIGNESGSIEVVETPGHIQWSSNHINPIYICCFSYPPGGDLTLLPGKFGQYRVRVDDPQQLAQDITDWLTHEGDLRGTPVVECRAVTYNKGEKAADILDHQERVRLTYTQKPPSFIEEHEYRFAVIATPRSGRDAPLHHEVVLGKRLPYATLLPPTA